MASWHLVRLALLCASASAFTSLAPAAFAQPATFSDGIYVLQGSSYSIQVAQEGNTLVVVEPNKRSVYLRQSDGSYHFRNPTNGILYGLRVIDNQTIEAFKPEAPGNAPTRLARLGGAPASPARASAAPEPAPTPAPAANPQMAIAERYRQLSRTDRDNAQAWTACAAAALKRAVGTGDEAHAYAVQTAEMLQLIIVDESKSPCPDAISDDAWNTALSRTADAREAAEREKEARLVQEGIERLQKENEARWQRLQADAQQQRAAQKAAEEAYERGMREAAAAKEQYDREMARNREEVARAEAARAEYERQMEEHRRLLASGRFKDLDD